MKKALLALVVILVLAGVIWWSVESSSAPVATDSTSPPQATTTETTTTNTTTSYTDGTYTGAAENAVYGTLQVVAVISGGEITSISFPQEPDAPGHTSEVSASALPQLEQEAIAIQGAKVDIVSGATQTSEAFQESLASALAQA